MERDSPINIAIVTVNPFPIGFASSNRIISYCKGFIQNDYTPLVICVKPTEKNNQVFNNKAIGTYKGIHYIYPGGETVRSKGFIKRRFQDGLGFVNSIIYIIRLKRQNNLRKIIFYGHYLFFELILCLISRSINIEIFKEESEHPNICLENYNYMLRIFYKWIYIIKLYKCYHAVLVMTEPLKSFFLSKGMKKEKILLVSQTIDIERFNEAPLFVNDYNFDYIAYAGSLSQKKDGVISLVKAFEIVFRKYSNLYLLIIGTGSSEDQKLLSEEIYKCSLTNRIILKGVIASDRIPDIFKNAKLLVSCRPDSLQAEYGFPTKVIEYMASKRPVVTTVAGDLSNSLKDKENAYISKSPEPEDFSSKIIEVLENYDLAMEVALRGKEFVIKMFNPQIQTLKIINYTK